MNDDVQEQQRITQKQKAYVTRLLDGCRQMMATREGRALARELLHVSGYLSANSCGVNGEQLNYIEGRRAVGGRLYALLAEQDKKNILLLMEDE